MTLRTTRYLLVRHKLLGVALPTLATSLISCGTLPTVLDAKILEPGNSQYRVTDIEREKIVYISEECEGAAKEIDSSKCARVLKDKDPRDEGKPDG